MNAFIMQTSYYNIIVFEHQKLKGNTNSYAFVQHKNVYTRSKPIVFVYSPIISTDILIFSTLIN